MTRKRIVTVSLLCLLTAAVLGAAASKPAIPPEDEKAIREVVQLYFDGIIKYDEQALRKAFHADANVIGTTKEGKADWEPFQEWVVYTRGDAPDPTGRNNRIVSIEVTGRAAIAKTDLDWPHVHYVDYLSLLRIDGQWKIVNKIWHRAEPK
ncbi:MAG: nuclear transport factor 2 family protein [bacterium]|nr:nuclear transport factor 2 family protein [bacterium]